MDKDREFRQREMEDMSGKERIQWFKEKLAFKLDKPIEEIEQLAITKEFERYVKEEFKC